MNTFKYTAFIVLLYVFMNEFCVCVGKRAYNSRCKPRLGISELKRKGCDVKRVATSGCHGQCFSSATPLTTGGFKKTCSCCSPTVVARFPVYLRCNNNVQVKVLMPRAVKCRCRPC